MGLDMYLDGHHYYGGQWKDNNHDNPICHHTLEIGGKFAEEHELEPKKINEVVTYVAYWRKANQIHGWFITNCADGVDNCQRTYVSKNDLESLVKVCKEVLKCLKKKDYDKVEELLPPQEGFFFGEYDVTSEWYQRDIEDTIKQLEPVLDNEKLDSFYYTASWQFLIVEREKSLFTLISARVR